MEKDDFRVFAQYYDHIYQKRKDYENESKIIREIIRKIENIQSKTLLDVGCGTGEHLKHLSSEYQCTGVDINRRMIEVARKKVPEARFKVANMIDFRLKDKFDVTICLFSSIGYVQSFKNLVKTFETFYRHLHDKGLVMVEPWVFKKDYKQAKISLDILEDEKVKFVRMATSKITRSEWLVFMHYLIGEKGEIRYTRELHKMALLDCEDYLKALKIAQFKDMEFFKDNLWDGCRGLFVARK